MRTYFFNIVVQGEKAPDLEGSLLLNDAAAFEEAELAAAEMAGEYIRRRETVPDITLEITDETGRSIGAVPLRSGVRV